MTPRQLVDPIGDEEQHRPLPQVGRDMPEQLQAGGIGPVQVLEEDEGWAGGAELGEEAAHVGEERGLVGDGIEHAAGEGGRRGWQRGIATDSRRRGRARDRRAGCSSGHSSGRSARRRRWPPSPGQVLGQRRLADARFAAKEHEPATTAKCGGELFAQDILLPRAADEERR